MFGSDLYQGLAGLDQHYLEFMPLMSLLQGAMVALFGLGVWQMRLLAAGLGTATLLLTFHLARDLAGARAALLTLLLLCAWRWRGPGDVLGTGIPLVDLSRIARYDILAAPLGLGALIVFWKARQGGRPRLSFAAGALAGLSGLAHVYGLFWIVALLAVLLTDRCLVSRRPGGADALGLAAGALCTWLPWLAFVAVHWSDFVRQLALNQARFDLASPAFYARNLAREVLRYNPRPWSADTWLSAGAWLLVLGVPAAVLHLARRAARQRDERALHLAVPCLVLPALFALLVERKYFNYVVCFAPLFAVAVATSFDSLLASRSRWPRLAAIAMLSLTALEGGHALVRMRSEATRALAPQETFRELRALVPAGARVLGFAHTWLALPDTDYHTYHGLWWGRGLPVPWEEGMRRVAPDFVLMSPTMFPAPSDHDAFWRFMRAHRARLLRELPDIDGRVLRVYAVERAEASGTR